MNEKKKKKKESSEIELFPISLFIVESKELAINETLMNKTKSIKRNVWCVYYLADYYIRDPIAGR